MPVLYYRSYITIPTWQSFGTQSNLTKDSLIARSHQPLFLIMLLSTSVLIQPLNSAIHPKIPRSCSPPGGAKAYQFQHGSINRQVANMVTTPSCRHGHQNDVNLALSPTSHYVSIESPL
ncbi:hypothetical protein TNCV_702341 [Trichonephila clavipes]|nr:hypothetical protein TNCV_702341 [Trichonephila clavipes]